MTSVPSGFEYGATGSSNGTSHLISLESFVTLILNDFLNFSFWPVAENISVFNLPDSISTIPGFWSRTLFLCSPLAFQLHPSKTCCHQNQPQYSYKSLEPADGEENLSLPEHDPDCWSGIHLTRALHQSHSPYAAFRSNGGISGLYFNFSSYSRCLRQAGWADKVDDCLDITKNFFRKHYMRQVSLCFISLSR